MSTDLAIPSPAQALATGSGFLLPATIADQGEKAAERFFTFFTDTIPNPNTRAAYYRNALRFFAWTARKGLSLPAIKSYHVSAYLADLTADHATPTVKQHLATLRMLFDWLITGQVIETNPAAAVRAAKHVVKKGKTPVLTAAEARQLLDSIQLRRGPEPEPGQEDSRPPCLTGLRDRALIAVMVYSFARVSAALAMRVEDYYTEGRRAWFRLHEKGGKRHEVPAHHNAENYLDAYLEAAGLAAEKKTPLFRSMDRSRQLTPRPMHRNDAWQMIKRRAKAAGLSEAVCCHTFRATGITAYLENGGTIEHAQQIANHESPKTTKLYDRTNDQITLDEVERIVI
ncbi:MAG: tyrosine-type recombinase/integrase [Acetobacteraceae bacterium]|nr:tyrosine-type recombinase/integrase [Acetobacteraceae bacterium]